MLSTWWLLYKILIKISHLEVVQIQYLIICQLNIVFNTYFCLNRERIIGQGFASDLIIKNEQHVGWESSCKLSPSSINLLQLSNNHISSSHFSLVPIWNIEENEKVFPASWPLIRERNLSLEDVVTMMIPM